jgi:hypothetical protein
MFKFSFFFVSFYLKPNLAKLHPMYIKANVVSVCVFVTDIRRLQPGQPLRGAKQGATTFYTSSVDA